MKHHTFLDIDRPIYYVKINPFNRLISDLEVDWLCQTPGQGYTLGGSGVYFYSQADATLFALKWS